MNSLFSDFFRARPQTAQDRSKTKFSSKKVSKKESKRLRNLETHGC